MLCVGRTAQSEGVAVKRVCIYYSHHYGAMALVVLSWTDDQYSAALFVSSDLSGCLFRLISNHLGACREYALIYVLAIRCELTRYGLVES